MSRNIRSTLAAAGVLVLALAACGGDDQTAGGTGSASLKLTAPASGSSIEGNVVRLDVESSGIEIKKADGDTSGASGHYHVFIDREPVAPGEVIPKEAGIVHSTDDPITITGLSVGQHTFKVVLGDGAHARIGTSVAETTVTVNGPSIDASAPATIPAGSDLTVEVAVSGVTLLPADADPGAAGTSGHLHVFVDREPTPAGQAIPKEDGIIHTAESTVTIPGLAAGEHTIWVVLGDAGHVPFEGPVADKLVVTVS